MHRRELWTPDVMAAASAALEASSELSHAGSHHTTWRDRTDDDGSSNPSS